MKNINKKDKILYFGSDVTPMKHSFQITKKILIAEIVL